MKLLVVGSGGREHAIAKKLLESKEVEKVFVAPGNDGMTLDGLELVNISISEHSELIEFVKANDKRCQECRKIRKIKLDKRGHNRYREFNPHQNIGNSTKNPYNRHASNLVPLFSMERNASRNFRVSILTHFLPPLF